MHTSWCPTEMGLLSMYTSRCPKRDTFFPCTHQTVQQRGVFSQCLWDRSLLSMYAWNCSTEKGLLSMYTWSSLRERPSLHAVHIRPSNRRASALFNLLMYHDIQVLTKLLATHLSQMYHCKIKFIFLLCQFDRLYNKLLQGFLNKYFTRFKWSSKFRYIAEINTCMSWFHATAHFFSNI